MRAATLIMRGLAWMIIAMLFIPPGIPAQDLDQPEQTEKFMKEELDQMLAPIALYPDSLIAQILMASTYPLEIVQAERWMQQNKTLTGDVLDNALKEKPWDPSIKSLCHFPDVLFAMSDKLDQTSKLGDAFLDQKDDVMSTIQELRRKAETHGNLKTTQEQKVIHQEDAIRIEPADRKVVYVPVYDPLYVYGQWWYPAYPPYYWYYPPSVIITGGYISFGPRFFIGIDLFSWSWFDWHRHYVYVDVHKARRFHRFPNRHYPDNRFSWRHNPVHRRGVAYRDRRTRERFGKRPYRRTAPGREMRGYPPRHNKTRAVDPSKTHLKPRKPGEVLRIKTERERTRRTQEHRKKADVSQVKRQRERIQRTQERRERAGAPGAKPEGKKLQIPEGRNTPFNGVGNGNFERKASQRGIQSRQGGDTRHQSGSIQRQGGGSRSSGQGSGRQGGGFRR
ncbi:MAG: hypothetical protein SRB2_03786 [Desulfobacteraceae bacterium Eth-SRB2]|nr:MAG: hypothetical protein SRB2_03786 [Desulfobacteraceae bacterium Eth-SRB2]